MSTSSSSEHELPDLPETPDTTGAYPRLTDEQIMLLFAVRRAEGADQGHHAVLRGGPRLRPVRRRWTARSGSSRRKTPRAGRECSPSTGGVASWVTCRC